MQKNKQEWRDLVFRHMIKEQYDLVMQAMAMARKICHMDGQDPNDNRLIELICADFLSGYNIIEQK